MENVVDQDGLCKVYLFLVKLLYVSFDYLDNGDDDEDMIVSGCYLFDLVKGYFIDGLLVVGNVDILIVLGGMYFIDILIVEGGLICYMIGGDDEFLLYVVYENLYLLGINGNIMGIVLFILGDIWIIDLSVMYFINYDFGLGLGFVDISVDDNFS